MLTLPMAEPPTSHPVTMKSWEVRLMLLSVHPVENVFNPLDAASTPE